MRIQLTLSKALNNEDLKTLGREHTKEQALRYDWVFLVTTKLIRPLKSFEHFNFPIKFVPKTFYVPKAPF